MATFKRMNQKEWKELARTIRTNKETEKIYHCGAWYDTEEWILVYSGMWGYGVSVMPIHGENKRGYIAACRVLYTLANNEQERKKELESARKWYNEHIKKGE